MSSTAKKRLTLTRTSVKDKMLRLLDQILFTTDELRQMINRHIGAMPEAEAEELAAAVNAAAEVYPPPPIRIPGQTRKKRESKGPEVSVLPEAASSPLAQNVKEAILNVKEPNAELSAELKKVTCPGGPAAFNLFRKRLSELLNQAGVTVTYDRMLEIAGPLYKVMCQNPVYVGTGRDGKPGVPFDPEQLAELQKGLERTQSLLRLSPEIMERIAALANGASLEELPPLTNATISLQRQRAALGLTKRGATKTRKVNKSVAVAAAAPSMLPSLTEEEMEEENQNGVSMIMPGAPVITAAAAKAAKTAGPLNLGKRIPQQITKLQGGINSAISNIQSLRSQVQVLGESVPRIKTRVSEYQKASEQELKALQTVRNQLNMISTIKPNTQANKDAIKTIIKNSMAALETTRKQATAFGKELAKVKGVESKGAVTALLNSAATTARNASKALSAPKINKKTKKVAKIQTPSGAVYAPGANISVGAVKPGPSNLFNTTTAAASAYNPFNSPPANNTAPASSNRNFSYENTNEGQAYRKVQVKNPETGKLGSYLMNSDGFLYNSSMAGVTGLNTEEAREPYLKGSYNKNTGSAVFV